MTNDLENSLMAAAKDARRNAYAPYSKFHVGASVLTPQGDIYTGSNIENASYGLTICAERVAIFSAIASGHRSIEHIAVSVHSADENSNGVPCGACLQVLAEFMRAEGEIHIDGKGKFKLRELLPHSFRLGPK